MTAPGLVTDTNLGPIRFSVPGIWMWNIEGLCKTTTGCAKTNTKKDKTVVVMGMERNIKVSIISTNKPVTRELK